MINLSKSKTVAIVGYRLFVGRRLALIALAVALRR